MREKPWCNFLSYRLQEHKHSNTRIGCQRGPGKVVQGQELLPWGLREGFL